MVNNLFSILFKCFIIYLIFNLLLHNHLSILSLQFFLAYHLKLFKHILSINQNSLSILNHILLILILLRWCKNFLVLFLLPVFLILLSSFLFLLFIIIAIYSNNEKDVMLKKIYPILAFFPIFHF